MDGIARLEPLLHQVELIREKYEEFARITGENFNIFKITRMEADEVRLHSAFLGELLNPHGCHGMGNTFLKLFIDQTGPGSKFETLDAHVSIEKYAGKVTEENGGRIDILIEDRKGNCVIIENKIYALDQPLQLERYFRYPAQHIKLYYLTLEGNRPSPESRGNLSEDEYTCISYKNDIIDWLDKCHKEAVSRPFLRETLGQYINLINYLTGQTMNEEEQQATVKTILQGSNILSASQIVRSWNQVKLQTELCFWEELERRIKSNGYNILSENKYSQQAIKNGVESNRTKEKELGIKFRINSVDEPCIYIERGRERLYYGLVKSGTGLLPPKEYTDLANKLKNSRLGGDISGDGWIWWKYFNEEINFETFSNKETLLLNQQEHRENVIHQLWSEIEGLITVLESK